MWSGLVISPHEIFDLMTSAMRRLLGYLSCGRTLLGIRLFLPKIIASYEYLNRHQIVNKTHFHKSTWVQSRLSHPCPVWTANYCKIYHVSNIIFGVPLTNLPWISSRIWVSDELKGFLPRLKITVYARLYFFSIRQVHWEHAAYALRVGLQLTNRVYS